MNLSVSVIVPVFDDQSGVDALLAAIEKQDYPKELIEVIVVDNASSPPISINQSSSRKLLVCEKPGAYSARNAGASVAKNEVLAFTDADCMPEPNWLSQGLSSFSELDKDKVIVGGEVLFTKIVKPTPTELYQLVSGFHQAHNIEALGFSATANLFVRREDFQLIGTFNDQLYSGGDREWCWRAKLQSYRLIFQSNAAVTTPPRKSLAGAIRQARRIAGGKYQLRRLELGELPDGALKPRRSAMSALSWIGTNKELSPYNKMRVLIVAVTLKLAFELEKFRLRFGFRAERK